MSSIQKLLEVPFSEKDEARALGARWLPQVKRWFVPTGVELAPFRRWLNPATAEILKIPSDVYIVESRQVCRRCRFDSRVYAIGLKPSDLEFIKDGKMPFLVLSSVEEMPAPLANDLRRAFPSYRPDYSKTAETTYYMNHCEQCGCSFGDYFLHDEPEGAFCPYDAEAAEKIFLIDTQHMAHFVTSVPGSSIGLDDRFEGFKSDLGYSTAHDLIWFYADHVTQPSTE